MDDLDPARVSPYWPAAPETPAIHEAGHTTAPDRMAPDHPPERSTSRTANRGRQPASRPLRGERHGRPCEQLLTASQKAGRPSTEARAGPGEPRRARGASVQQY